MSIERPKIEAQPETKAVLPYEGDALSRYLIEKQRTAARPSELEGKRKEFERIYERLPEIANRLVTRYSEILHRYGLDPGEVRLYMVGGRVRGKPLAEDSDIDLFIAVEDPQQGADGGISSLYRLLAQRLDLKDVMEAWDVKHSMWKKIRAVISEACQELGITDEFHILGYGGSVPKDEKGTDGPLLIGVHQKE